MRVHVNGVSLWFEVSGPALTLDDGVVRPLPTLVAVHGGPGVDHTSSRLNLEPLTGHAQVIFYDQRGHGRSDYSSAEHWNLSTWASDLRGFCDALGIERPVVLGSSFGGFVALTYAALFPDHPGAVILTNTTGGRTNYTRSVEVFRRLGGDQAADVAARDFAEHTEESAPPLIASATRSSAQGPATCRRLHDEPGWASVPARSTCTTGTRRNRALIPGTCCPAFPARSRSSPARMTPSARWNSYRI